LFAALQYGQAAGEYIRLESFHPIAHKIAHKELNTLSLPIVGINHRPWHRYLISAPVQPPQGNNYYRNSN
jgi:hypothetical protein